MFGYVADGCCNCCACWQVSVVLGKNFEMACEEGWLLDLEFDWRGFWWDCGCGLVLKWLVRVDMLAEFACSLGLDECSWLLVSTFAFGASII